MGKSIQIKDPASGDSLYPITKPELVQDDKGNTVMELFPVQEGNVTGSVVIRDGLNKTSNAHEFACGRLNSTVQSNENGTLFSVGIGRSLNNRNNAFEVRQNGDIYLLVNGKLCKIEKITQNEIDDLFND